MTLSHTLLAFGFGHAMMLGWLSAAALPVVIHLWSRRKYREVPWAAVTFLLAAMRKNARRIRLEQWLLLAVRTLLVILVVLALAEPFWEQAGRLLNVGQRTLKVLVIDASYSMAARSGDTSVFERAKQSAAEIVAQSRQGDGFALVLLGAPPSTIVGAPALDPKTFLEEIESLRLPHTGGDLPATLIKVEEILDAAKSSNFSRHEVYFLTDLGRTSWRPDLSAPDAEAAFRQRAARLAHSAALVVVDVGQSSRENLAVTDLRLDEPFITIDRPATLHAQVHNFGIRPVSHQRIEFLVDGRSAHEAHLDIEAGGDTTVAFNYRFDTPGEHVVEARVAGDLLDVDNHRWLALDVKPFVRVLCVNGKPATGNMSGATDYLTLALNPESDDAAAGGVVRAEAIPESGLVERDLTQYDCVFLCNVGQFTASEAKLLNSYLQQGGGLVFFLGDQVLADRYNRELTGDHGIHVLPAQLQGPAASSSYRFDPLNYRHPLVGKFSGREEAGLLTTPIYKYVRMALPPDSQAHVALAFDSGDPAIIEERIGRGRSIVVATDGSLSSVDGGNGTPWTTLPAWPSYLPIVQELLALAVQGQATHHNILVGDTLGAESRPASSQSDLTIHTPDGGEERLRSTVDGDISRWTFADTSQSGQYTAQYASPLAAQQFAVNVNTKESDLARIAPNELPTGFTTNRNATLDDSLAAPVNSRAGLHKLLLYAALGLLLLETGLAARFGRHTS